MKKKDSLYAILAVVILLVAGYLGYTQLFPQKSANGGGVVVEKVGNIPSQFDANALAQISDHSVVTDYNTAVELSGLGNLTPFGR